MFVVVSYHILYSQNSLFGNDNSENKNDNEISLRDSFKVHTAKNDAPLSYVIFTYQYRHTST